MARQRSHKSRKSAKKPVKRATVRVAHIGAAGDGVALVDDAKVFTPYAAPGDEAIIEHSGGRGKIIELLAKGPERRAAPCEYFGRCGGCALQHVQDEFYSRWKHSLVATALAREGFDDAVLTPLVSCPAASRRRARFAVRRTQNGMVFGVNERLSAQIVDISTCLILAPPLGESLGRLRALASAAPSRWRIFDLMVTLCDNGLDVSLLGGDADDELSGTELAALTDAARDAEVIRLSIAYEPVVSFQTPIVSFGGVPVEPPAAGFLQASREGEAALARLVTKQLQQATHIADLFCGCGTFSLPLSEVAQVDAFDSDQLAVGALDTAARKAALRHAVSAARRNLFDRPLTTAELKHYDAVVFDPPRAGAQAQSEQLAQSAVPLVVGVSCNPVSFARDVRILREGGYALSQVTPVDQFVYSPHVELVGVFTKG